MKIIRPKTVTDGGGFARASVATYWGADGILREATTNVARVSYDPEDFTKPPTFLLEKTSTNLLVKTDYLAQWTANGATWTDNFSLSCAFSRASTKVTGYNTGTRYLYQIVPTPGVYTYSCLMKIGTQNAGTLYLDNLGGTSASARFDLYTGAINLNGSATLSAKITFIDSPDSAPATQRGWARVEMQVYITTTCSVHIWTDGGASDFIEACCPQLELGYEATSIIHTSIGTFTRAADINTNGMLSLLTETEVGGWSSASPFLAGDQVAVNHRIYEATRGRAFQVTMTVATPGVVNAVAHGMAVNQSFYFTFTGAPGGVSTYVPYYVLSPVADTFTFSATMGGAPVAVSSAGNNVSVRTLEMLNKPPASNPTLWLDAGPTNKWAVFDQSVESQTEATDYILFAVKTTSSELVDSVIVQNIENCRFARVVMQDDLEGVVYDKTISLISTSGVNDPFAYTFEPIVYADQFLLNDLPRYANATIMVSLLNPGATVKAGLCVIGLSRTLGYTQAGVSLGIQDYSVKERDTFGNSDIQEGAYSRTMNASVWVESTQRNAVINLLNSYRATAIVYVADINDPTTWLYGYFRDYSDGIDQPTVSVLNIEIESLT